MNTGRTGIHVRALIRRKGELLLCHFPKGGFFFLPGGSLLFQETLKQGLVRELREEMGWLPENFSVGELRTTLEIIYDNQHGIDHIFDVTLLGDPPVISRESHIAFVWVPLVAIPELDLRPGVLKKWIGSQFHESHLVHDTVHTRAERG